MHSGWTINTMYNHWTIINQCTPFFFQPGLGGRKQVEADSRAADDVLTSIDNELGPLNRVKPR